MPDTYTDRNGKTHHGRVAGQVRAREERESAEALALRTVRSVARLNILLAARATGLPGPDALHALAATARGGPLQFEVEDIEQAAGVSASRPAGSWSPGETADHRPAAAQSRTGAMWQGNPDHDSRVVQAIVRGATDAEINAIRAQVMAEYAERAAGRQAAGQRSVLWRTRSGELVTDGSPQVVGASFGPAGQPVQRSQVNPSVPELGSEEV